MSAAAKTLKFTMITAYTASKTSPIFAQLASQMAQLLRNLTLLLCKTPTNSPLMTPKKMRSFLEEHLAMRAGRASTGSCAVMIITHFLGDVGTKELLELGIADEVFDDYAKRDEYDVKMAREVLVAGGDFAGYLFRCLHCKKHHIYIDAC